MSTDILMPMFYMVVLTSVVFLFNVLIRLKDVLVDKGHTGSELMKILSPRRLTILSNKQIEI